MRAVTLHLCSELSRCNADKHVRILLSVIMNVPVSVAHCLFGLQLCSSDCVSFSYEHTCTAEADLQTLPVGIGGNRRHRGMRQIILTKGPLRPCRIWPRRGSTGPRTSQQSVTQARRVSAPARDTSITGTTGSYVCRAADETWHACWSQQTILKCCMQTQRGQLRHTTAKCKAAVCSRRLLSILQRKFRLRNGNTCFAGNCTSRGSHARTSRLALVKREEPLLISCRSGSLDRDSTNAYVSSLFDWRVGLVQSSHR